MILPETYAVALALSILSMLCWGSWANTTKLTSSKWRFELYYYDFAFGVLLTSVIAAFTLGAFGSELSFVDNVSITGKRHMFYGVMAGVVFNLANMLLVAAISLAGMAVAFPVGIGLALVVGVLLSYFLSSGGNTMLLFSGVAVVVAAIVLTAMAHSARTAEQPTTAKKKPSAGKGLAISLFSGVLMGVFYPLVVLSRQTEIGLGPYSVAFFFAIGVFLSTFLFNFYFMNLPVQGEPVSFSSYFRGSSSDHLLGIAGGAVWCAGAIAHFVASSVPDSAKVGPAISYALGQGAPVVSALWGLLVWKEFQNASGKAKGFVGAALGLYVVGLLLVSLAPLYAR